MSKKKKTEGLFNNRIFGIRPDQGLPGAGVPGRRVRDGLIPKHIPDGILLV